MKEEQDQVGKFEISGSVAGDVGAIGVVSLTFDPTAGNKLRVTFSWTYSGPSGTYYAMAQLGNARAGLPFDAKAKVISSGFSVPATTQVVIDIPITTAIPDGIYEVECDICTDASGTDQSIYTYKQGVLDNIEVKSVGAFTGLAVTYTKV
jgi:hypothetical protein